MYLTNCSLFPLCETIDDYQHYSRGYYILRFLILTLLNAVYKYVHTYIYTCTRFTYMCETSRTSFSRNLSPTDSTIRAKRTSGFKVAIYMYIRSLRELTWRPAFWEIWNFTVKSTIVTRARIFAEQTGDEFMGERLRSPRESEPVHPYMMCICIYRDNENMYCAHKERPETRTVGLHPLCRRSRKCQRTANCHSVANCRAIVTLLRSACGNLTAERDMRDSLEFCLTISLSLSLSCH